MAKVSRRGGFSDRNGIKTINAEIQLKKFDQRTRTQLQNMVSYLYEAVYQGDLYYRGEHIQGYLKFVLGDVFSEPVDVRKLYDDNVIIRMINETIMHEPYDDVLTLIEAIIQYWDQYLKDVKGHFYYSEYHKAYAKKSIYEEVNEYFEREYVGYRFIDGRIVPISDTYEVESLK